MTRGGPMRSRSMKKNRSRRSKRQPATHPALLVVAVCCLVSAFTVVLSLSMSFSEVETACCGNVVDARVAPGHLQIEQAPPRGPSTTANTHHSARSWHGRWANRRVVDSLPQLLSSKELRYDVRGSSCGKGAITAQHTPYTNTATSAAAWSTCFSIQRGPQAESTTTAATVVAFTAPLFSCGLIARARSRPPSPVNNAEPRQRQIHRPMTLQANLAAAYSGASRYRGERSSSWHRHPAETRWVKNHDGFESQRAVPLFVPDGSDNGQYFATGLWAKPKPHDDCGSSTALWMATIGGEKGRVGLSGANAKSAAPLPAHQRPPMLITIGPQCAGKTTLLGRLADTARRRQEKGSSSSPSPSSSDTSAAITSLTDVAIDDHPSVYFKIPAGLLLKGCPAGSKEDQVMGGRHLNERLADVGCLEARLIALRLLGKISADKFASGVNGYGGKASPAALAALSSAVESAVSEGIRVSTPTVDVFIVENLFLQAISASQERLATAAKNEKGMVAWGNTNIQARDFRGALQQAELTGRPVRFLRWGHELPFLSLEELSRRNVCRFASTGRYVETAAIEIALARVEKLYASTSGGNPIELAFTAGFHMDASGGVKSISTRAPRHPSGRGDGGPRSGGSMTRGRGGSGGGRGPSNGLPGAGDTVARSSNSDGSSGRENNLEESERNSGEGFSSAFPEERTAVRRVQQLPKKNSDIKMGFSVTDSAAGTDRGLPVSILHDEGILPSPQRAPTLINRPLPVGGLTDGAYRHGTTVTGASTLGLAQEWTPQGGARLPIAGGSSISAGGWRSSGGETAPSTVMFMSQWGRNRAWRRTYYDDSDIDAQIFSCNFNNPANSTGGLRRSDGGEGVGADYEEMDLFRRIKSFREKR